MPFVSIALTFIVIVQPATLPIDVRFDELTKGIQTSSEGRTGRLIDRAKLRWEGKDFCGAALDLNRVLQSSELADKDRITAMGYLGITHKLAGNQRDSQRAFSECYQIQGAEARKAEFAKALADARSNVVQGASWVDAMVDPATVDLWVRSEIRNGRAWEIRLEVDSTGQSSRIEELEEEGRAIVKGANLILKPRSGKPLHSLTMDMHPSRERMTLQGEMMLNGEWTQDFVLGVEPGESPAFGIWEHVEPPGSFRTIYLTIQTNGDYSLFTRITDRGTIKIKDGRYEFSGKMRRADNDGKYELPSRARLKLTSGIVAQIWTRATFKRSVRAAVLHAMLNTQFGSANRAFQSLGSYFEDDPENPDLFEARGRILLALKQPERALADARKSIELDPDNFEAMEVAGLAHLELKNHKEARDAFTARLRISPGDANAYLHRGDANKALGDIAAARSDFENALRLNEDLDLEVSERLKSLK